MASRFSVTPTELARDLGLPRSALLRKPKPKRDRYLTPAQGERVIGLSRLVGLIQIVVEESSDVVAFDAPCWLGRWLAMPNPSLDGRRPAQFIDTITGQELVGSLLRKFQTAAFA
jgi:uncharacterized protein (DUF2384 family)